MPDDISLLPEHLRSKEEELKKKQPASEDSTGLKFSMPVEEKDDVEVIEVDEGEIDQVLAGEPWFSRMAYQATNFIEGLKHKLFEPNVPPPPPKLPPQFFVPPVAKAAPSGPQPVPQAQRQTVGADAVLANAAPPLQEGVVSGKPKVRIIPSETAPRRVRVIRRVRKPLRVSFVSEEELRLAHIDVPKRRFTLITAVFFCILLLGGGYTLLQAQVRGAQDSLKNAKSQTEQIRKRIAEKQAAWSSFQDLEPRLKVLGVLLDQHMSPTHVLSVIEQNTLPTVSYGSFALTSDGKVALSVTADSIDSAAAQIVAFQKTSFVKKVEASSYSITYGDSGSRRPEMVTFQLGLTLSDTALRPNALVISP